MNVKSNQVLLLKAFLFSSIMVVSGCATQSKAPQSPMVKTEPSVEASSKKQAESTATRLTSKVETESAPTKTETDEKTAETKAPAKKVAPKKKIVKKKEETSSKQVKKVASKPKATKTSVTPAKKSKVSVKKAPEKTIAVKEEKTVTTPPAPVIKNKATEEALPEEVALASKLDDTTVSIVEISSLDQLPLALSSDWEIDVIAPPAETKKMCLLTHVQDNVFDGYEETSISVVVGLDRVWFKSKSNLDLSYPESGFQVMDKGGNLLQTKSLQLTQRPDAAFVDVSIADLPLQSADILIKTGFWPSWPVTETRSFTVPAHNAKALTSALQTCARLLN